jgi:multiple sugar transport system permease protein
MGIRLRPKTTRAIGSIGRHTLLIILCASVMAPMLLMVTTSLKSRGELFRIPLTMLPNRVTFTSYIQLWTQRPFVIFFANSLIVAVASTLIATLVAVMAGFGMSRYRVFGRKTILAGILMSQMIPATVIVVPFFKFLSAVGLYNSLIGLIAAHTSFAIPFATWMAIGFFRGIPSQIDDAAIVDGCSPFQRLFIIMVPLLRPGLVAMAIFTFLLSWKEYFFALSLASNERMYTLPVGIGSLVGEYGVAWNDVMAASVLAAIPAIGAYVILERHLVGGLVAGAVKG